MQFNKRKLYFSLLLTFLLGHLVVLIFQIEFWPFSPYPMYSKPLMDKTWSHVEFRVVLKDGHEEKLAVRKHFFPYWERALIESWSNHQESSSFDQQQFLRALLDWRNQKRAEAEPVWEGLRIYSTEYSLKELRAKARDGTAFSSRPPFEKAELLAEVLRP
jgi:hypothetical protein